MGGIPVRWASGDAAFSTVRFAMHKMWATARFVALLGITSWMGAVHFGLFMWIGFPVILLTGSVLWENIPWKVAAIHAGDWLVKMLVIPIIVSLWH